MKNQENGRLTSSTKKRLHSLSNQETASDIIDYDPEFNIEDSANSSGDEDRYKDDAYLASFSKLLEHDKYGQLTDQGAQQFEELVSRMRYDSNGTGQNVNGNLNGNLNGVIRANNNNTNSRVWVNPQAAFSYSLKGGDISYFKMRTAPSLKSAENAAEMMEVYMQTLCRDVAFNDYGTCLGTDKYKMDNGEVVSLTNFACKVLNQFGDDFRGPKENGQVTPNTLFRGLAKTATGIESDKTGFYLSQFLLQPLYPLFPAGCAPFVGGLIGVNRLNQEVLARPQHYPIAGQREFGITLEEFVKIQNGEIPKAYIASDYNQDLLRHLKNGRDMGSLVHTDGPYEAYYNALNILIYNDFPRCSNFPYNNGIIMNESDGHQMGPSDVYTMIAEVCLEAFKAAWAQKWRLHRKHRPEAMAGIINLAKKSENSRAFAEFQKFRDKKYLHPIFFTELSSQALEIIRQRNIEQSEVCNDLNATEADTYLLAQMYPEGSPAHPAYPSGHATVAGACTTVIKAIFDDNQNFAAHLDRNNNGAKTKVSRPHPNIETQLLSLEDVNVDNSTGQPADNCHETWRNMTVGSELDKLASNIALGRNFGGVHYRQDGDEGILLGEKVAIKYLQDHLLNYPESDFDGYTFSRRNGRTIKITKENIVCPDPPNS